MSFEVYCDESRPELFVSDQPSARYSLIGSLWLPAEARGPLKVAIRDLRAQHGAWGEIKWTKVSPSQLAFYTALVDLFFSAPALRFRCIAIDSTKLNVKKYHSADAELGFYKFYYQLLLHWIEPGSSYQIFCDQKVNRDRTRLRQLAQVIRNARRASQIADIQAVNSTESVLVQLCDLLLGATQAKANRSLIGSSAKAALIEHIEMHLGRELKATYFSEQKFNVFAINLDGSNA